MPASGERGSPVGGVGDGPFRCLVGRQGGRVEPPTCVAELALHVDFEPFVSIEVEAIFGVPRCVSVLAHVDSGRQDNEPNGSR